VTDFPNGEANEAREQLIRTAARAHRLEVALVAVGCLVGLVLATVIVVGLVRLEDYARVNKALGEQNVRLLEGRAQSDQFGRQAVQCVLDQFALHRITNQEFHDGLAAALHVHATPISPLPPLPTDQQVTEDCAPFYRR